MAKRDQIAEEATPKGAFVVALTILFVVAAASFMPERRLWGINHLAYYPLPIRFIALGVIGLSFVPQIARGVGRVFTVFRSNARLHRRKYSWGVVAVAVLSIFLFYGFHSATLLLGDGDVVANDNNNRVAHPSNKAGVPVTAVGIVKSDHTSPGTSLAYYLSGVVQTGLFSLQSVTALRIFNCLLGGIFVFLVLTIVIRSGINDTLALWLLALTFTSGAMQLFFGYVENYTPLFVVGFLYVANGVRVIHGKGRLWVSIVLFFLAAFLHVSGVLLGLSLVFLVLWRTNRSREKRMLRILAPVLAVASVTVTYVAGWHSPLGEFFLPIMPTAGYSALSLDHWVDVANELMLLLLALPVVLYLGYTVRRTTTRDPGQARSKWFSLRVEWHFALMLLLPAALYLLFFDPVIGLGRDWDLFTVALFGVAPISLLIVNRVCLARGPLSPTVSVPMLVMGAIVTASWIGVNASPSRSTERFEHLLVYQEQRTDYGYEILAKTYHGQGRLADAIRVQEIASSISNNPRHHLTLAKYYRELGDIEASMLCLQRAIVSRPEYRPARRELIATYFNSRRYQDAIRAAQKGLEYHPNDPFYIYWGGRSLLSLGRIDEGRSALIEARRFSTNPELNTAIDSELRRIGN